MLEIDLAQVEKLGQHGATPEEIAAWFGISLDKLSRELDQPESAIGIAYRKGHAKLKISIRRQLIDQAGKGKIPAIHSVLGERTVEPKNALPPLSPEDISYLRKISRESG